MTLLRSIAEARPVYGSMTGLSRINFEAFATKFDFSNSATLATLAALPACFASSFQRHPDLQCVSLDLPAMEPIPRKHIAAALLTDRIKTVKGDFSGNRL